MITVPVSLDVSVDVVTSATVGSLVVAVLVVDAVAEDDELAPVVEPLVSSPVVPTVGPQPVTASTVARAVTRTFPL